MNGPKSCSVCGMPVLKGACRAQQRVDALVGFVGRVLPVDPESDRLVEAYAAERERRNPTPRRPIPWRPDRRGEGGGL